MTGPFDDSASLTPLEDLLNDVVDAVNGRMNAGRITGLTLITGATSIDTPSTPHGCSSTPEVVGAMFGTTTSAIYKVNTKSVDASNFVLTIQRTDGAAMTGQVRDFTWLAIVPTP